MNDSAAFAAHDMAGWREAALRLLKGRPLETLIHRTIDGVEVRPLYSAEDAPPLHLGGAPGAPPFVRGRSAAGTTGGWILVESLEMTDPAAFALAAREAVRCGATGLEALHLSAEDLDIALDGVHFDAVDVALRGGRRETEALLAFADARGMTARGGAPVPASRVGNDEGLGPLTLRCPAGVRTWSVDASDFRDAGAPPAQALGLALAAAAEALRVFGDWGVEASAAARHAEITLALGPELLIELATVRAARACWGRLLEVSGGAAVDAGATHVRARTARWTETTLDPQTNMLRGTSTLR